MFRERDPLEAGGRSAKYPRGRLAPRFRQLAQLIRSDLGIRVAFLESGGWDTHFAQGGAEGSMANSLRELAGSITAFLEDVGAAAPVTLLTVTEFGRTAKTNGPAAPTTVMGRSCSSPARAFGVVGCWETGCLSTPRTSSRAETSRSRRIFETPSRRSRPRRSESIVRSSFFRAIARRRSGSWLRLAQLADELLKSPLDLSFEDAVTWLAGARPE